MMSQKEHLPLILLLAAITLLVYYDSFNNGFVYDDNPFVVENKAIHSLDVKSVIANFTDMKCASSSEDLSRDIWRPFVTTSFAIDYRLWKLDPHFYHAENVAWHIINAVLVYLVTLLVLESPIAAFIASLVFAIHPVQTEAVTWISGRSNVLFLFFFLLSLIFHIRNRMYKDNPLNYSLSIILFTFSLFCKEMAIVLPLVLILYDIHFYRKQEFKSYINYYTPYFIIAASYILARFSVLGVIAQSPGWWGGSFFTNMLITLKAVAGYIGLLFLPINLKVEYKADIPKSILDPSLLPAGLILLAIALIYLAYRKKKEVSFYMLWFFITLIPVYNIVPFKAVMAERFLYLPLIGFASILGIVISNVNLKPDINKNVRQVSNIVIAVILVAYAILTISRNVEWRDELTFYMQDAVRSPLDAKAHYNLGYAYANTAAKNKSSKDLSSSYYMLAIKEFEKTRQLKPVSEIAYAGMANAYNELGLYDPAIKNFKKSIAIKEESDVYNNLAVAYYKKAMYTQAIMACKKALYLKPEHLNAYINLGNAYFMKSEYKKALKAWLVSIKLGDKGHHLAEKVKYLEAQGY